MILVLALHVGIPLFYVLVMGFAWALTSYWKDDTDRAFAMIFWPASLVIWCVYQIFWLGPNIVTWMRRPKLPKATAIIR